MSDLSTTITNLLCPSHSPSATTHPWTEWTPVPLLNKQHLEVTLTVKQCLEVPAGTTLVMDPFGDTMLQLPDGTTIKPCLVLEADEDHDMTNDELSAQGCYWGDVLERVYDF